jgi:hypothetical protein
MAIHFAVLVLCPNLAVPPRLSKQVLMIAASLGLNVLPFGWSIGLLLGYRTLPERIVAYVSLVASFFWLALAADLAVSVLGELRTL